MVIENLNQCQMVIKYLENYGSITPLEAIRDLGIYRLGARIWDLKNKYGLEIRSRNKKVKNRFGKETVVAEYYMEKI